MMLTEYNPSVVPGTATACWVKVDVDSKLVLKIDQFVVVEAHVPKTGKGWRRVSWFLNNVRLPLHLLNGSVVVESTDKDTVVHWMWEYDELCSPRTPQDVLIRTDLGWNILRFSCGVAGPLFHEGITEDELLRGTHVGCNLLIPAISQHYADLSKTYAADDDA
jgi:hypothetical protein